MLIINNFTNYKRIKKLPEVDILIWTTSLIRYKSFGYKTKIYCTENDISFLKQWHLYELYDYIDTELYKNNEMLNKIDNNHFWSARKLEAIYNELFVLNNKDFVYSDVDVIMRQPFDLQLNVDCMVWSPEDVESIYVPWDLLSTPEKYELPDYIKETEHAYNCGLLYFKNKEVFKEFRKQYYAFALNNPCILNKSTLTEKDLRDIDEKAIWACNAEQRILKAVLTHYKQKVKTIMNAERDGWCNEGSHYFFYRVIWRKNLTDMIAVRRDGLITPVAMLNLTILECLMTLKDLHPALYRFWSNIEWLKGFETLINIENKLYPIRRYY